MLSFASYIKDQESQPFVPISQQHQRCLNSRSLQHGQSQNNRDAYSPFGCNSSGFSSSRNMSQGLGTSTGSNLAFHSDGGLHQSSAGTNSRLCSDSAIVCSCGTPAARSNISYNLV